MESGSAEAQGTHDTTPFMVKHPAKEEPVEPIALPTADDVGPTLPDPADPLLEGDATVLSTKPKVEVPRDLPTGQATSPIEMVITASVVRLTSPIIPYQEERWYTLVVTAFSEEVEFRSNQSHPWGHSDCLCWRSSLLESPNGNSSPWTH